MHTSQKCIIMEYGRMRACERDGEIRSDINREVESERWGSKKSMCAIVYHVKNANF